MLSDGISIDSEEVQDIDLDLTRVSIPDSIFGFDQVNQIIDDQDLSLGIDIESMVSLNLVNGVIDDQDLSIGSDPESIIDLNQVNQVIDDHNLSSGSGFSDNIHSSDVTTSDLNDGSVGFSPKEISSCQSGVISAGNSLYRTSTLALPTSCSTNSEDSEGGYSSDYHYVHDGLIYSESSKTIHDFHNVAFSSASLKCSSDTSGKAANTSKRNTPSDSRYSRALQLIRSGFVQVKNTSAPLKEENCTAEGCHDLDTYLFKDEDLYDFVSNVLLQKFTVEGSLVSEDFTENGGDPPDLLEDFSTPSNASEVFSLCNSSYVERDVGLCGNLVGNNVRYTVTGNFLNAGKIPLQENFNPLEKLRSQVDLFYTRVKMSNYSLELTSQQQEKSHLEKYLEKIKSSSSQSVITENISILSRALKTSKSVSYAFLSNYYLFIYSVIESELNLVGINEFLVHFLPCVKAVMRGSFEEKLIKEIRDCSILPLLYNSLRKMISKETKYNQVTVSDFLELRHNTVKAHIVRMQPEESQILFQETFFGAGNLTDLYLIYIWRILKLYEIQSSDVSELFAECISDKMEQSGRFISIIPVKELSKSETKFQFLRERKIFLSEREAQQGMLVDLNFEWVEFRIGQVYENGVVYITNIDDWPKQLKEISSHISKLEVKRCVSFVPSLGSTFGLHLKDGLRVLKRVEDVSYIRVRVVRVVGPVAHVYGIDTGNVMVSEVAHLILLPADILGIPPCGRLAQLPVVPAPAAGLILPTLDHLVALTQCQDLAQDLCSVDVRCVAIWLQVPELTLPLLYLLKAILTVAIDTPLMDDICIIITDHLLRVTSKQIKNRLCVYRALAILISAMEASSKARLLLAKEGVFVTLCNLGLRLGNEQVWNVVRMLLGGRDGMASWLFVSKKLSQIQHGRLQNLVVSKEKTTEKHDGDPSVSVIRVASFPNLDRNWDLEIRGTISTRQLVPYFESAGWCWKNQEVLTAIIGDLHYGHKLDVRNDETHHIILDKSIPNIRMNTLLQIILGMLNTGLGGKIYIGLNNLSVVHGVRMTRDQRDCFMLGFSKLITSEIFPMVLPCDSLIQFIPVLHSGHSSTPGQSSVPVSASLSSEITFVVILTVRPQLNLLYRYRSDPESIFMREGGATSTVRGHRLSELKVTLKKQHLDLVEEVSQEKQALLKVINLNSMKDT